MDLQNIRVEIDKVDKEIVKLFEKRMELANEVANSKKGTGKPVYDKEREEYKLTELSKLANGEFNKKGVCELFSQIMTISRRYQYSLLSDSDQYIEKLYNRIDSLDINEDTKVVYQGVPGAYSEQACLQFFGNSVQSFNVKEFKDIMTTLSEGRADFGVLPIENSSAGTVAGIYELLLDNSLTIVGEEYVKVNQALLGVKGAKLSDITSVYSHPQGLLQCTDYLDNAGWEQLSLANTALAAQKVHEDNDVHKAAIASERAAKLYDLDILNDNINNNKHNTTRFIILANKKVYVKDADKISISFVLPHSSGSLYNLIAHFIYNNLNMTKIESKPLKDKEWEYRFFIEFTGNLNDASVKNALTGIRGETKEFRIYGNF